MRKELPKFFEQILYIKGPGYIATTEQQRDTANLSAEKGFCLLVIIVLIYL